MSIPVEQSDIGEQMTRFGTAAYVLTVRDDQTTHIAHLQIRLEGDVLRCGASRTAAANVSERPYISVLWPPYEPGGYSMIVDVRAKVVEVGYEESDDGADTGAVQNLETASPELELELVPITGVLHRPAAPTNPPTEGECASDCAPLRSS